MENVTLNDNLFADHLTGLPNFFNFIKTDFNKVFGEKGFFIIFNVLDLRVINEKYGEAKGDLCINAIAKAILSVVTKYDNTYTFRFGLNDFIVIMPNCLSKSTEDIVFQIEKHFNDSLYKLEFNSVRIHSLTISYNQQIEFVEDFYEILFNNIISQSSDSDSQYRSGRLLRHVIDTYTRNVNKVLTYYNYARDTALIDDISGLHNHRAGKAHLRNLIGKNVFSVLFIDGDNLKRYNSLSYEAGNEMIRQLSQIISNSLRKEDRVFRWLSGDEFLVVLEGVTQIEAVKLAERVREAVEKRTKDFLYPTTISIGVTSYPADGSDLVEIVGKAEQANKYAKKVGKNKVVIWDASI